MRVQKIAWIVFALLFAVLVYNTFILSPRLSTSLAKLEATQLHLDNATRELEITRKQVDSIRLNLLKFNNYLITIQAQTTVLYKEKEIREEKFKFRKDSLLTEVYKLKEKIDTIQIPALKIYDSRFHNP